jgi:hypothetical protein
MLINNLSEHLTSYRNSLDAAIKRVLDSALLVLGPEVKKNKFLEIIC